ncbi:DUF4198 domain-containing protein [Zoogloeaceae bacteirum Par-f-2]|nr:DUF4198 domain-containing protein [Zoogloeaceae bacteirum Par-f-2]
MCHRTILRTALYSLVLAGTAVSAHAHTVWLEPEHGFYRVMYGGHEGKTEPYPVEKLKSVFAYAADGTPLSVQREDDADGVRVRAAGEAAVLTLFFDNGIWSRPEGGRSVNKPMNEVPGATSAVQALKYHKTIARWGVAATRAWGQPFELVAVDQAPPRAGEPLRLRVLIDGKPAAGIKVAADESAPGVFSDAEGLVTVRPQAGFNKLWAGQRTAVSGDPRMTTVSIEYLLTFEAEPPQ